MAAGMLPGIRVIEAGDYIAAPFCTRLLADLGADVIKVEPPEGDSARRAGPFPGDVADPERSGLFLALNSGKRSVTLDLKAPGGAEAFARLAAGGDVLVEDLGPGALAGLGLAPSRLLAENPGLVIVSISPFGGSGPYHDRRASDLVLFHMSGYAPLVAGNVVDPQAQPPLRAGGSQAEFVTGVSAAAAAAMGLSLRDLTGCGCEIEVSGFEAMVLMPQSQIAEAALGRPPRSRRGGGLSGNAIVAILPAADGHIAISPREEHQWNAWVEIMGSPDWAAEERFRTREARQSNWQDLEPLVASWTRLQPKQTLYRRCQAAHVPAFPVNTAADLFASEHLRAREFFRLLEHPVADMLPYAGRPFKTTLEMPEARAAPLLGADTTAALAVPPARADRAPPPPAGTGHLPLRGYRVLDLSWIIAGPTCTRVLALMGADVIKVESRRRPDPSRGGANFLFLNQSKRSLSLNLSTPQGLDLARRLVPMCDALVENYATGVIERLGLGYDVLKEISPRAVMLSSSGLGHTGPDRDHVAYGTLLQCFTGWSSQTGYEGRTPVIGGAWSDPMTGMMQAFLLTCAMRHARATGQGMYIDFSMAEAMCAVLPEALMEFAMNGRVLAPLGNRDRRWAPHDVYRCRGDDAWMALAVRDEDEWRALCESIGAPDLARDARFATAQARRTHQDTVDALIESWTRERTPEEATALLQRAGVPAGPSLHAGQVVADPHLLARGFFRPVAGPGGMPIALPALPWRFLGGPEPAVAPAPEMGADTVALLKEHLGLSSDEIEALERDGVLY